MVTATGKLISVLLFTKVCVCGGGGGGGLIRGGVFIMNFTVYTLFMLCLR